MSCIPPIVQEVLGLQAAEDGAGGGGLAAAGWLAARPRHRGQVLHRPHEDQGEVISYIAF